MNGVIRGAAWVGGLVAVSVTAAGLTLYIVRNIADRPIEVILASFGALIALVIVGVCVMALFVEEAMNG